MPMTSNIQVSKMSFKNRSWPQRQNAASCCFYKTLYSVATRLRYDVTFSDSVVTNFLPILTVNKFRKSLSPIFNEVKAYKNGVIFGPPCTVCIGGGVCSTTCFLSSTARCRMLPLFIALFCTLLLLLLLPDNDDDDDVVCYKTHAPVSYTHLTLPTILRV